MSVRIVISAFVLALLPLASSSLVRA
ncbi:c-type cytochrome, methanol metabolism-related, partial [Mesorhizobium sp. M7A.F.Ca.CA.002.09.1.1]